MVDGPDILGRKQAVLNDLSRVTSLGRELTVQYDKIAVTTSGDTAIISGVSGYKIVVLGFWCTTGSATALLWKSSSTEISGTFSLATNGGCSIHNDFGLMETADGENLTLNNSNVATVGGTITYVFVPV